MGEADDGEPLMAVPAIQMTTACHGSKKTRRTAWPFPRFFGSGYPGALLCSNR
jgi:hypothetical protein